MPRCWCWLLVSALAAAPAGAATQLERTLVHTRTPAGEVLESTRLKVRLETAEDLDSWQSYAVYLDEHRQLESLTARVTLASGEAMPRRRIKEDTLAVPGLGELHSSAKYRTLTFGALDLGSVVEIEQVVRVAPYYPAGDLQVRTKDAVTSLRVELKGFPQGLKFHLESGTDSWSVEPRDDGLALTARDLPALDPPDNAPEEAVSGPTLTYSWAPANDWQGFGEWYLGLLRSVPRDTAALGRQAAELTTGLTAPRQKLEALARFVQEKVRYVAVEVGVGGYQPSPPAETLARRWGDCKDKALLLIELAKAVGIEAWPVLIEAGGSTKIDPAVPGPGWFNHLIVAVPAEAAGALPEDPQNDGLLFIDATQTRGGLAWLNSSVQDRQALVVRAGASRLAQLPALPASERTELAVTLAATPNGSASGGAGVRLVGGLAAQFLDLAASAAPERLDATVRALFGLLLPGVKVSTVAWAPQDGPLPEVSLTAAVTLEGFVQGEEDRRSLQLPAHELSPELRAFSNRKVALVASPGVLESDWKVHLPAGACPPEAQNQRVETAAGSFELHLEPGQSSFRVVKKTVLNRHRVELEALPTLLELAQAEHRGGRRRLRLTCPEPVTSSP
ncbi:MAG: transglutaminase family protein [Thermoanaerobaculia bacterium]